jgi:K+-transporting ATPase ATPase C chain
MWSELRPAVSLLLFMTALTGLAYPVLVTGVAQILFPHQANGSLIEQDGTVIGSELIGQNFTDPRYFWGRPSATGPEAYNAAASSGSNQGPTNPALHTAVADRIVVLRAADPGNTAPVPVDLVTASGSGLDPHVSVAAAKYQAARVAHARSMDAGHLETLIAAHTSRPLVPGFGEPIVNVLALNLALDAGA